MGGGGSAPQAPQFSSDFITDPYDPRIKSMDTTAQKQSLMRDFARAGGQARAQALASSAQALGGSRSTGTAGQLADIAAQQSYGQQKGLADLAGQEFNQRVNLLDVLNNIQQAKNAQKADVYNMGMTNYNAQNNRQHADINSVLQALGITAAIGAG